ncbi:MAG: hypothetical protein RIQ60_2923 [Pseudomonadota bacterium]|jgi:hypothetical protein
MAVRSSPTPTPLPSLPSPSRLRRRAATRLLALAGAGGGLLALLLSAGCSGTPQISADVASYGSWPGGRPAGQYSIERLPSQQRVGQAQEQLEAAARGALERAGFSPAAAPEQADVLVQVAGRQGRVLEAGPWVNFGYSGWWGRPGFHGRYPGRWAGSPRGISSIGIGFGGYLGPEPTREYREVALMLIDRASRSALVEVHVRQEARYVSDASVGAMFDAALQGFPQLPEGERTVVVPYAPGG